MNFLQDYTLNELHNLYKQAVEMGENMPYTVDEFEALVEEIEYRELGRLYDDDNDETDHRKDYLENYASDIEFEACDVDEVLNIHFGM